MRFIRVHTVAPDVNVWLANTRRPRILHVFEQACNLINDNREVVSIVSGVIGNGPFHMVIEDPVLFADHLQCNLPVCILHNQLRIGDLVFYLPGAKPWFPRPHWEKLYEERAKTAAQLAAFPRVSSQVPHLSISNLTAALASGDVSSATAAASQLAGLGVGLTPAGDDFIMGALYAAWMIHPVSKTHDLAREVASAAAPLTTSLSAAYLRAAGKGEAGILWHKFFNALVSGPSDLVRDSMEKILSVGATSGADALAGFLGTFNSWMEYNTIACQS